VSILDGPGEGTWSAFAAKVVEERDAALDVGRMREDLLVEIDAVLQGSAYWVGGRLDTIKRIVDEIKRLHLLRHTHGSPCNWLLQIRDAYVKHLPREYLDSLGVEVAAGDCGEQVVVNMTVRLFTEAARLRAWAAKARVAMQMADREMRWHHVSEVNSARLAICAVLDEEVP
jgi:hypothetical protein